LEGSRVEQYIINGAIVLGVQAVALGVVRSWFSNVDKRLDALNGFKDRMLANHVTKEDLRQHEERCTVKHQDIFHRIHELEMMRSGITKGPMKP
jgi:hypothetical protein